MVGPSSTGTSARAAVKCSGMLVVDKFINGPHPCAYLDERTSTLEYELVAALSPEEYEARMNAGWRKFGAMLFHPVCRACDLCRPIRIDVAAFTPNRTQRKTLKRSAHLRVVVGEARADEDHLVLYHRYHAAQTAFKGWPEASLTPMDYELTFVENPVPGLEVAVYDRDELIAVALTDITPNVLSGVYHYYAPERRDEGIGTFTLLQTLALAKQLGKRWAYFGYYVAGSRSMMYKAAFRPCEILGPDGKWAPLGD